MTLDDSPRKYSHFIMATGSKHKVLSLGAIGVASWIIYKSFIQTHPSPSTASQNGPKYLHVAGDRSQVGKSTVCLALMKSLIDQKVVSPSEIAYIKPMTQCIKPTEVARYCLMNGIECAPIGPIVFKRGFTSEVIDGKHGSRESRLQSIKREIERIGKDKKLVIIDGVGYVSVGSVINIDNVDVAKLLNAYSILIVRSGIGDSIDTTNLLLSYYEAKDIQYFRDRFVGVIYNVKERAKSKVYRIPNISKYVSTYFERHRSDLKILGWIPPTPKDNVVVPDEVSGCMMNKQPEKILWKDWPVLNESESEWVSTFTQNVSENIDVQHIVKSLELL